MTAFSKKESSYLRVTHSTIRGLAPRFILLNVLLHRQASSWSALREQKVADNDLGDRAALDPGEDGAPPAEPWTALGHGTIRGVEMRSPEY